MMLPSSNRSYDRHELCISSKMDIGGYLGYARVQLIDEKKPFVVIKARGNAIENALKVPSRPSPGSSHALRYACSSLSRRGPLLTTLKSRGAVRS